MNRKTIFRTVFLSVTAVAVGLEVLAATDSSSDTEPWTHLVVDYVPAPLALAFFLYLGRWVYLHFVDAYGKKGIPMASIKTDAKNRAVRTILQGFVAAVLLGAGEAVRQALTEAASGSVQLDFGQTAKVAALGALFAGLMAGLSYLHRTVVDPSPIPSVPPPEPGGGVIESS